jgi:2OG-Fe(II) oxygenase superfamily
LNVFASNGRSVRKMTGKQLMDAFSETLMQDERILSPRERELLIKLLQNSKTIASQDPATQAAVGQTIARALGETVAQRAFGLLGSSIVEQILAQSGISADDAVMQSERADPPGPQPPAAVPRPKDDPPGPQPPAVKRPLKDIPPGPQPPAGPQGASTVRPLSVRDAGHAAGGVGVLESAATEKAQCVVLDEFLAPQELDDLVCYALEHEGDFHSSEVISPSGEPGIVDYNHRRSRVLLDLGKHERVILDRIEGVLPQVLEQLGIEAFPVTRVETQITASNDGDFFRVHSDDAQASIASRRLTFVYFFHREPRQFEGGELRIHDSEGDDELNFSAGSYQSIVPQQNQIVFFPCSMMHEITPVNCPSRAFADSRFTLNGWLHQ